ncbi:hypothetical protein EHW99_1826 [Erwinia amylovora]|uniref:Uncharacterized protein n=2 Tax=Erwinia amylovora TaxID=552 RepID=A0A830ZSX5_ERWAM|nr:hypothetical protein EaACW_1765 [Erwinia amylovora ACW56400]QJQ54530.1 hypothetical protein EHX00_1826 [Erwinia amylovora]CBA20708.1 hypothetical protein predicted by Glimmer/Critica [Erwinia amylovora CFBP1430]CCO78613.1 hypothetical protein BN432_1815 [Erwinia amylovora Ea356]CCO86192.1 hypothetical protein BN434_1804 [Erwinia amylovora CFBP 2585]CCO89979.1 hypothetical protein BN435_1808 [Erwinia amylovora 01SFR-BO]CCO93738.1 hypothetical protein BN437_1808 [Erwinia amylovora NBRC 12687
MYSIALQVSHFLCLAAVMIIVYELILNSHSAPSTDD